MQTQIASTAQEALVLGAIADAEADHGSDIRADERYSPPAVAGQRAMLRSALMRSALYCEHALGRPRADEERMAQINGVMVEALGLREVDGRMDGMTARADSYTLPGELIARDGNPIRVRDQRRALQENVGVRNVEPGAEVYETNAIDYEGKASIVRPGDTNIPHADFGTKGTKRLLHSIVTRTAIDWERLLYSAGSISIAGEKAEAADRALKTALETVLALGATGTDLRGLFGINSLIAAKRHSAVDMSLDATTLAAIYTEFMAWADSIREANGYRGGVGDTLGIAPILFAKLRGKSNLAAGGSATGANMFMALAGQNAQLGEALKAMGISQVIEIPAFNVVPGSVGTETDRAGAVIYDRGNSDGLRHVLALAPSPVRTSQTLTADETLWALRTGGLEAPDATAVGIATFKVR